MKTVPQISDAERLVMKVLWKKAPGTAQDVSSALADTSEWSFATVKTLLNRLVRKKVLAFEKEKDGKAYLYTPLYTEEECQAAEVKSFLERVFDGALSPMLAHLMQSQTLSQKQISELEHMLENSKQADRP